MSTSAEKTGRVIGIRHRVKVTKAGEARPTQIAIREPDGAITLFDAKTEGQELTFISEKLRPGDVIAMSLGGAGDLLAFSTNRIALAIGATFLRITPFELKAARGHDDTEGDAQLLANLAATQPELFHEVLDRDAELILVRETYRAFDEARKQRIACEQRLHQFAIGRVYTTSEGIFPEGGIEKEYGKLKANDAVLEALKKEERKRQLELEKQLKTFDVYTEVFVPIVGLGPLIAARIITAIGDVRRFKTANRLVAFCGVHLTTDKDGSTVFPRRRRGVVANWHGDARQALWLFGDQWNRRPDSMWGKIFRENKEHFRRVHPEPIKVDGKWRYNKAHIHKMAGWRTATQFVRWLFGEWWSVVDPEWHRGREESHAKWLKLGERIFGHEAWSGVPGSVKDAAMRYALGDEPETALARALAEYDARWAPIIGEDWWNDPKTSRDLKNLVVGKFEKCGNVAEAIALAKEELHYQDIQQKGAIVFGDDSWNAMNRREKLERWDTYRSADQLSAHEVWEAWDAKWQQIFGGWWQIASFRIRRKATTFYDGHGDTARAIKEAQALEKPAA